MGKRYGGVGSRMIKPGSQRPVVKTAPSSDILDRIVNAVRNLYNGLENPRAVMGGLAAGIVLAFLVILVVDFYRVRSLASFEPNVPTKIYDKNGILISELFRQKREVVSIKRMPKDLLDAFVAIEDNEFYDHFGINPKGIVRAFFINVFSGRIRQGGSTITQQLSKILLTSRERSIYRKIKEAFIALMMELFYSKEEILELYLNQIFLGHGTYGVESASEFYFNKHIWQLDLAECAILASLPSSPNTLSPIRYPEKSIERHKIVLAKMVEMGYITIPEAERAFLGFWPDYLYYINELPPSINTWSARVDRAPWFSEYVRRTLIRTYGEEKIFDEGLQVYTTLDITKQEPAQRLLKEVLERQTTVSGNLLFKKDDYVIDHYSDTVGLLSMLFNISPFMKTGSVEMKRINDYLKEQIVDSLTLVNYLSGSDNLGELIDGYRIGFAEDREFQEVEGCLVSIDHRTGYIEALVGGSEFTSINQLNRAMQSIRQPGSAIKPLLYAAAMESRKFTPATTVLDSPLVYLDTEGGDWIPENYEGGYYGLLRLRKALALSINVASLKIADGLGIATVMKYYSKLLKLSGDEARRRIPRNFSIALGSLEVSPYELTRAYAIIANGGKDVIPFSIRYIKDRRGTVLENNEEEIRKRLQKMSSDGSIQVIRPDTAQIMISMLQSVISSGTGQSASLGRPAGGKTGTTNNWKDAWFVGFVPQITTGIWMGYDKLGLSLGIGQAGGAVVAPLWGEYMRAAMQNEPAAGFPAYAGLAEREVCAVSGLVPTSSCGETVAEVFIPGTEPEEQCDLCAEGGPRPKLTHKGPKENISEGQREAIMKNIKKRKDGSSVLNNIGNDLLK